MAATHSDALDGIASRRCAHCRLPLPLRPHTQIESGTTLFFCCIGCVFVSRIIGGADGGGRADWFLAKLGLAALLSGNIMMFQSLTYFGTLDALGPEVVRTSSWIMFSCSIAVFAMLGVPMLKVAIGGLVRGRLSLETLIGFGALMAIGFSAAQTLRGGHRLYYDSGTMVLVFVTFGQYLDAESRRRALTLLSPTLRGMRRMARLARDGVELQLSPGLVRAGELVYVRAGEEIPVDGTVTAGSADVHAPLLTGEWRPQLVKPGDWVSAGSTAVDGALTVYASGVAETLADRVERFAVEAREARAPIEAIVDRVVAIFVPAVILVAIASVGLWGLAGDWERGVQAALAVLVVACPCALGIATPMATTVALSVAVRRGCLVRSGAVLESLSRLRAVAFDKTGTITVGRPQIAGYYAASGMTWSADEILSLAASVEQEVTHPFARALVKEARNRGCPLRPATDVRVSAGGGAEGLVMGSHVLVGKRSWLSGRGIVMPAKSAVAEGSSEVTVAIDGQFAAEWSIEDLAREEAPAALLALERMGVSCYLLSGDRREVVARIAALVGCKNFVGELLPEAKPRHIGLWQDSLGLVAMVGDGVNDAPALGSANVGIAFGPAADLAKETADVTILSEDLREIPYLVALARKTFKVVQQNLAWAFIYNVIAIIIAAGGFLRPVFAAIAMVLSSVCVVENSMRLRRHSFESGGR